MTQDTSKKHFLALDALRGIVAIFVVVWHSPQFWTDIPFGYTYLAVDIFFVLSGFVIAHAYKEKLQTKKISGWDFLKIRIVRLYPMYFIGLMLGLIAYFLGAFTLHSNWMLLALMSLFFLPTGLQPGQTLFAFNLPAWSLFYELIVNIIYGYFNHFLSKKRLLIIIGVLGIALILIAIYKQKIDFGAIAGYKNMIIAFIRSSFGIFVGIFIYQFHLQKKKNSNVTRLISISCLLGILIIPRIDIIDPIIDLLAILIIIPYGVLTISRSQISGIAIKICDFLGEISYPLYAIHYPVMLIFISLYSEEIQRHQNFSGVILVVILIALSSHITKHMEKPLRAYLHTITLKSKHKI
jgi:peptidoglycan/LPS O-acetylase OafA/YrhL